MASLRLIATLVCCLTATCISGMAIGKQNTKLETSDGSLSKRNSFSDVDWSSVLEDANEALNTLGDEISDRTGRMRDTLSTREYSFSSEIWQYPDPLSHFKKFDDGNVVDAGEDVGDALDDAFDNIWRRSNRIRRDADVSVSDEEMDALMTSVNDILETLGEDIDLDALDEIMDEFLDKNMADD